MERVIYRVEMKFLPEHEGEGVVMPTEEQVEKALVNMTDNLNLDATVYVDTVTP